MFPERADFSKYRVIASDELLHRLNDYVKNGGHVVMAFKSGFTNENSTARSSIQVVELKQNGEWLNADRDAPTHIALRHD